MSKKILYFDTETTDLQAKDLVQLAFITENPDIWLNMYFKPKLDISYAAMAIHNITPEDVKDCPYFEDAQLPTEGLDPNFKGTSLKEYLEYLADNYIWIAHNVEFDVEVLKKKGIEIPHTICTLKVSRNALTENDTDLESYKLQYLRYYLGLYKKEDKDHVTAHNALSDVYFLKDLFTYLKENTKLSIENMEMITKQPMMIRVMTFGKYAGKTFEEVERIDREYLEWVANAMTDKPDVQWNARRVLDSGSRNRTQSLF